jgi:hypothetical protein
MLYQPLLLLLVLAFESLLPLLAEPDPLILPKEFDKKYSPTWHCIVGRNFGSYVTHETKHFIYFYLGQVAVLLFKSG